ncbi:hypothetical protein KFL_000880210 [Klebsormidium nitens]|uniref:Uncharacterized protein n=1 Tax=Klebsormidium nitens TaxID=105231 RepID=A0A1Y1HYU9_KLENI|nr:hypothetical protein KFL_000880210 [Klebsormidium nitens]|eukprot:GAQ81707.1 hypothetical protein KFL_000880210 [Klebsormidium nitens]
MNTWSGLKTRKGGDTPSETAVRPPDPAANTTSLDPADSAGPYPHTGAGAPFPSVTHELTHEGHAHQKSPHHSPEASKSMEVIDRFGRLIQDWAKPSQATPPFHGNPPNPSSPSVARIIGQPSALLRPPSTGGSAFSPVTTSIQVELWQPQQRERGEEGKWPVRLFPRIPTPNAGAPNAAQEGVSSPPPSTTTLTGAPAEPSPTTLPPAFGGAISAPQHFDYRLPFSGAAPERRLQIPPGLEIARVIDARSGSQAPALEPSYYDFLQLEGRQTAAAQEDTESDAPSAGHIGLELHHLPSSGDPVTSLPLFHHKQAGLYRGGFKVPTLIPPLADPEFRDLSPNQPDTPTNLGVPTAKDPDAWEERPVQENKAAGGIQGETAGKGVRGVYDKKTGLFQHMKGGFRAFSGGLGYLDAEGPPRGGPGLVAHRTWSAVPVTSPPGSPPRALSDSGLKRAWEASHAAERLGKRPRLTLEQLEPRQTDVDRNEPEGNEAVVRNRDPQDNDPFKEASKPLSGSGLAVESADGMGRQLANAQRQLSDARSQLSDAQRQASDARQQLVDAQASWETDRRQWRQKEAAWEAFRTARMQPGGSPVAGGGSPAVARAGRYSEDEIGRLISERLIRTESMLIAALAEIGRLRAWIAGMRAAPRAGAPGAPPEGSASGDTVRA